jgi:hypothetical protein
VHLGDRRGELIAFEEVSLQDVVEGCIGAFEGGRADGLLPDSGAREESRVG